MTEVKSGKHLGAVRGWIQRNRGSLGSLVTWGSDTSLGEFTVRELEEISQTVRDATVREYKGNLERLLRLSKRGAKYGHVDYADTHFKFCLISSDLEKMLEEMEEEDD